MSSITSICRCCAERCSRSVRRAAARGRSRRSARPSSGILSSDEAVSAMDARSDSCSTAKRATCIDSTQVHEGGARNRQAAERDPADPLRVRRRRHPAELYRVAAQGARRHARSAQRAPASRRSRGRSTAVRHARAHLRRQCGPVARARRRSRRVPAGAPQFCARKRSHTSGLAIRSRSRRTRRPKVAR